MKRSETINDLAAALAKAQKSFTAAERDHTAKVELKSGGNYSFNYADLAAYLEVCRAPLGDNGLSVIQEPVIKGNEVSVTTLLMHATGQWIESEPLILPVIGQGDKQVVTPQAIGSAITYARRYSLSTLVGMASEADDDGNAASGNKADTGKREPLPACPKCRSTTGVIIGKPEYGGGFVCFAKKGGCGHKWQPSHESSEVTAWKSRFDPETMNLESLNALLPEMRKIGDKAFREQVFAMACEFADGNGCMFDKAAKAFVVKE